MNLTSLIIDLFCLDGGVKPLLKVALSILQKVSMNINLNEISESEASFTDQSNMFSTSDVSTLAKKEQVTSR